MINQITMRLTRRWEKWAKRRNRPGNIQSLNSHNIYILPSKFGWAYGLIVLVTFIGAINSQINTVFLMSFLLTMIGMVSAFEAHANFKNLTFKLIAIEDAQQGTPAKVTLLIQAHPKNRFGINFQVASQPSTLVEKIPAEGLQFDLPIETKTRGYFSLPPIVISSFFPFGIFRVFSYLHFEGNYYVYPQPINPEFWPEPFIEQDVKKKYAAGDEEFYDLKQIENPWVQPNMIAWKIAAKGQGWYLKTMDRNEVNYWLFKLTDLSSENIELKLQYLSYWLQTAELNGLIYGLEIKTPTPFSHGKMHLQTCLRQLALYE